jgi:hypothetical protein
MNTDRLIHGRLDVSNPDGRWSRARHTLIILFLAWHFTGVLCWLSPDSPLKQKLIPPFIGYLNFFGMWQGWSVFEVPRTYNEYLTAKVAFKDGSEKTWEFPRMEKLNTVDKMFKEGYRRWANDCVSDTSDSFLWPDATRYIARINRDNGGSGNPPVSVSIIRHWIWIDPPEIGISKPLRTTDDGQETLCTQAIATKDLE